MAKEGELKRVDLKVNVSCCDGCRRKVMKAMSLKGVLRTEIHPTLDRVTVVGNVDTALLVRKLAKVRKIAEVVEAASPEDKKKREEQGGRDRDGGDWTAPPAPVMAGENSKRKDDGGDWTAPAPVMAGEKSKSKGDGKDSSGEKPSSKKECHKCAQQQQKQQSARGGDHGDHGKAPAPSSKGDAESAFKEERDGFTAEAKPEHAPAAAHQHYHRAEPPSMAVPMQYNMPTTPYYAAAASVAAPSYYNGGGGYYAMPPPPPPAPTMPMQYMPMQQQQLVRAQPSRFDVDYFNEDNAVGCHVM